MLPPQSQCAHQQHSHHGGACQKCIISDSIPRGVLVNVLQPTFLGGVCLEGVLCSVCLFPWCKSSCHGMLQDPSVKSDHRVKQEVNGWLLSSRLAAAPHTPAPQTYWIRIFTPTNSPGSSHVWEARVQATALYCLNVQLAVRCWPWAGVLLPLYRPPCWNLQNRNLVGPPGTEHRCNRPLISGAAEWGWV